MSTTIKSKLPNIGTTIFSHISALATEHQAINLGQGFPEFNAPQQLLDRVTYHMAAGRNQYAPLSGVTELRQQIALKVADLYGWQACAESEVTVVSGATEGLFCAITATVKPGDEVIVFDPAYDSYEPAVELTGGRCIHIPLIPPKFAVDWQQVKDAITARTRMIVVNTPHNPTGTLFSQQDWDTLAELVRDTQIVILSDEVYEHLVFDRQRHHSILAHQELAERAFAVFSFGKTYHATGWKTGYVIAPKAFTAELRKVHQYVTFAGVTPVQFALADYMASCPEHCAQLPDFYQQKRDLFCDLLATSKFAFQPTPATFFQLVECSDLSDSTLSGLSDIELAEKMIREVGVAAVPISVFYEKPVAGCYLRFCFAKEEETLTAAVNKLCQL